MENLDFTGRRVIVTGAGRGIGREYALLLGARGASVVVADLGANTDGSGIDGDDPAAAVAAEVVAAGGTAVSVLADVSTEAGAASIVAAALDAFGGIDAVINNAGIVRTADWKEVPVSEYQRHLDVHYLGSMLLTREAWPHLVASGTGRVVNTISAAMLGNPMLTHYGSSKGAVFGLTRNLALEGLTDGVLVNAVAPGAGGTRMMEATTAALSDDIVEYMRTALLPSLVAPLGAFLVHPTSTVTGEVFNVAGGFVNRMAIVNSAGFHDPELSVESIVSNWDAVMTMPEGSQVQEVAPAQVPA